MSALSKIVSRAKQMRKARPNKHRKWTAYVKDAAKEYKAGGKPKKRKAAPKVKARRKRRLSAISGVKTVRRRKRRVSVVRTVARRRAPRKVAVKRRRVGNGNGNGGGAMKTLLPVLLVGGGLLAAYMLLKKNNTTAPPVGGYPPLINTANQQRNQTSQNILNYAMAAGLATDAILKLISALNTKSDADVKKVAETIDSGGGIPDWILYGY